MLDKTTAIPIYYQLKEWLRAEIAKGAWKPGDLIPSERDLSEQFGISRMTVRQALNELREEGLLRREQGRGTYVAEPKIEQRLTRLSGFTEDMKRRGLRSETRVLRQMWVEAPVPVSRALRISAGKQVVLLERLRMAEQEPMAIESCYLYFNESDNGDKGDLWRIPTSGTIVPSLVIRADAVPHPSGGVGKFIAGFDVSDNDSIIAFFIRGRIENGTSKADKELFVKNGV